MFFWCSFFIRPPATDNPPDLLSAPQLQRLRTSFFGLCLFFCAIIYLVDSRLVVFLYIYISLNLTIFTMISLPINSNTKNNQPFHFPCPESDTSNDSTSPSSSLSDSSITSASSCASSFTLPDATSASPAAACPGMLKVASPSMAPTPILSIPSTPILSSNPKPTNRPKLSLQTSCLPVTFGKSTTALSLPPSATAPSRSPTSRNTFKNAFDSYSETAAPSQPQNTSSSRPPWQRRCTPQEANVTCDHRSDAPYDLPKGVRSILRNSPIRETASAPETAVEDSAPSSTGRNTATGVGGRRILIPVKKRVSYRFPLDEEIKTVRFTARHSDLPSLSSSALNSPSDDAYVYSSLDEDSDSSTCEDTSLCTTKKDDSNILNNPRLPKRKSRRGERQIRAAGIRDGLLVPDTTTTTTNNNNNNNKSYSECPQTPSHRGQKRLRQWRWTLGPIKDGYVQPISPTGSPPPPQQQQQPLSQTSSTPTTTIPPIITTNAATSGSCCTMTEAGISQLLKERRRLGGNVTTISTPASHLPPL